MDSNNKIKIWHWNANGFRCRKAILQQYLRSLAPTARPDVIAVQETHTEDTPTLPGRDTAIELCATELAISGKGRGTRDARKKKTSTTVFIANIYSNPRHGKQKFKTLFHKMKSATSQAQKDLAKRGDAAAVICGDFNAQHRELGYTTTTSKGRNLLEDAGEAEFTLLMNPAHPSRIGTSVARDTNPDLTFAMLPEGGTAKWRNTGINLGSDHFIIEIELPLAHLNGNPNRDKTSKHKLVDWSKFRNTELGEVDNIDEWDAGRGAARGVALAHQHQRDEGAVYVDAARYPGRRNAFAAVVVSATTGKLLTASTVRARTAGQAEEAAIALATGPNRGSNDAEGGSTINGAREQRHYRHHCVGAAPHARRSLLDKCEFDLFSIEFSRDPRCASVPAESLGTQLCAPSLLEGPIMQTRTPAQARPDPLALVAHPS
ncbi:hypothetical protein MRX96_058605 [Rhipicephalus microplus]